MFTAAHGPFARKANETNGFAIAEVVVSLLILGLTVGGMLTVYVQCAVRADWSAYSYAAQMMAMSGVEQCRCAKYDPRGSPGVDELVNSNFPSRFDVLDIGGKTNVVAYGTNFTTITTVSASTLVKMIQVDCVWSYPRRGMFTNRVVTYRAPNQ